MFLEESGRYFCGKDYFVMFPMVLLPIEGSFTDCLGYFRDEEGFILLFSCYCYFLIYLF
jgi:hypothetical protein